VDADGHPETPVSQAVEKKTQQNRVKAGLALAAIGIVVAVILARRNAAGSAQATSGVPPTAGGGAGSVAGSGIDNSYVQNLQGQLGGLQTQLGSVQTLLGHEQATNATLLASEKAQNSALAALKKQLAALAHAQGGKGSTPAEINASNYAKDVGAGKGGFSLIGSITGGKYAGKNSKSGAPVYALVNTGYGPVWEQGLDPSKLPNGTKVATLNQFAPQFH
jgi:hypothetical protein